MVRVDIHSQTKDTIFKVYNYLKKLSKDETNPEVAKYFCLPQSITAEACGVSLGTVKRITSEGKKSMNADSEAGSSNPSFTSRK